MCQARQNTLAHCNTVDMTNTSHQIDLDDEPNSVTAFSTNNGHYQFARLPFSLKMSSKSFQAMLSIALA